MQMCATLPLIMRIRDHELNLIAWNFLLKKKKNKLQFDQTTSIKFFKYIFENYSSYVSKTHWRTTRKHSFLKSPKAKILKQFMKIMEKIIKIPNDEVMF